LIELVSPSTVQRDRYTKRELYARFGVKEYWIGDPANKALEILTLKGAHYELHCCAEEQGKLSSVVMPALKFDLGLVTLKSGEPHWNIGAFGKTDWEDAFLSLGVHVPPSLQRESGLLDWRAVLTRCIEEIGQGNLPAEVLGKVSAW